MRAETVRKLSRKESYCGGKKRVKYEGTLDKRFMNFLALQPLDVDEAFMPHMKAIDVPFHTMYGSLICSKGLQSDRPKC